MTIARVVLDELVAHARESAPNECCGVLLGVGDRITSAVRARNVLASPTRFELDPRDHIAARRQARAAHLDVIGFYHSHPRSSAHPSRTDIEQWTYPDALALILGVNDGAVEARAFRIADDGVSELLLRREDDAGEQRLWEQRP